MNLDDLIEEYRTNFGEDGEIIDCYEEDALEFAFIQLNNHGFKGSLDNLMDLYIKIHGEDGKIICYTEECALEFMFDKFTKDNDEYELLMNQKEELNDIIEDDGVLKLFE